MQTGGVGVIGQRVLDRGQSFAGSNEKAVQLARRQLLFVVFALIVLSVEQESLVQTADALQQHIEIGHLLGLTQFNAINGRSRGTTGVAQQHQGIDIRHVAQGPHLFDVALQWRDQSGNALHFCHVGRTLEGVQGALHSVRHLNRRFGVCQKVFQHLQVNARLGYENFSQSIVAVGIGIGCRLGFGIGKADRSGDCSAARASAWPARRLT